MLCLCILVMYALFCIFCFHRANWHSPTTLTEVFPCFILSCKANARVYLIKTGHGPHSSQLVNCVVLFIVLCVNVYCTTATGCQHNQLTNIPFILKASKAFFVTGTNRTVISGETKSHALLAFRSKLCSRIRLLVALSAVSVHRVRTDVTLPANKAFHRVQRCPTDLLPDQKLASVCSRV